MKKNQMRKVSVAVLAVLLLAANTAWAKTIRVRFPKGKNSVVLKGRTTGGPSESGGMDPITYTFRARKGQRLTLNLTSEKKNAVFGVYAPGMDLVEGAQTVNDWNGTLPKTGQYEIIVFPEDEATDTNFTLKITIE